MPDSVKRLASKKIHASVEAGAGSSSFASDDDYRASGARVDGSLWALLADADAVIQIRPPTVADVANLREGSTLVSLDLSPKNPTGTVGGIDSSFRS